MLDKTVSSHRTASGPPEYSIHQVSENLYRLQYSVTPHAMPPKAVAKIEAPKKSWWRKQYDNVLLYRSWYLKVAGQALLFGVVVFA